MNTAVDIFMKMHGMLPAMPEPVAALPGVRLEINELSLELHVGFRSVMPVVVFEQKAPATIIVQFDYEKGQRAITDRAPEDCQEGYPEEFIVRKVFAGELIHFHADGISMQIPAGHDLTELLTHEQVVAIEEELAGVYS